MRLIKSIVRRGRKFAQARSLPLCRASLLVPGYEFSVAESAGRRGAGVDVGTTEARKCFPSIVASTGENSL